MRLNTFTIAYLKEFPIENQPEILYDVVVNEVNNNFDQEDEILADLGELLQVNYFVYRFVLEINNGGFLNFFYSDISGSYPYIIDALIKINAQETYSCLYDAVSILKEELDMEEEELCLALQSNSLYELENMDTIVIGLRDLDYRIKENDEPVMDFLVKFIKDSIKNMNDDDVL